jgi:hypothetical protein
VGHPCLPCCLAFSDFYHMICGVKHGKQHGRLDDPRPVGHRTWMTHRPWVIPACHAVCHFWHLKAVDKS